MIHGIGTDIVHIERIQALLLKQGNRFVQKIFSPREEALLSRRYGEHYSQAAAYVAKRFAAKEACAKALGCGIGAGLRFHEVEIINNDMGKPLVILQGEAFANVRGCYHNRTRFPIHLSLSDEREYAQAMVVIEILPFPHV